MQWALLEAATDDYIAREDARLEACTALLLRGIGEPCEPPCGSPSRRPAPQAAAAQFLRLGASGVHLSAPLT